MSQERAQQLYEEVAMLESQYSETTRQESMLAAAHRDALAAAATLRAAEQDTALETLVPVGAGAFFGARVDDTNKIVIDIGAGVAVEKDRASALNHIEEQIKSLEVAIGNAAEQKQQIAARMQQGRQELDRMAQSAMLSAQGNV